MNVKADESWVVPATWEKLNPVWRDRILVILEDLAGLSGLDWVAVLDEEARALTKVIGPGGSLRPPEEMPSLARFALLAREYSRAWKAVGEREPSHIIEEIENCIVVTGIVADLVIVAGFKEGVARGAVVMRLTKRIRHLRSLQKSRERGALYV
ncbi:MAG: hypothetical protein V2A56_09025 [bacterium]